MKKRHQRLVLNVLAFSVMAIAIYFVLQKEKPFSPNPTLNANAATR